MAVRTISASDLSIIASFEGGSKVKCGKHIPFGNMIPYSRLLFKAVSKRILEAGILPLKVIWKGRLAGKRLALTFDDGPDPDHTPRVLDILSQFGLTATFFLLGHKAERHRNVVKEIIEQGHEIGNHSFDHNKFQAKPICDFGFQIEKTNRVLENLVGIRPKIFRPPYGILNMPLLVYCMKNHINMAMWSLDCRDSFEHGFVPGLHGLEWAGRNDIVLMHDDSEVSEKILKSELPCLIERGFSFVNISSMFEKR